MALKALGLPYMGSKRKIAHNIINTLVRRHPEATSEYVDKFDSQAFYKWFRELKQPAYFSSYENAGGFQCIKEIPKIGLRSAGEDRKLKLEKLYWNGVN